MQYALDLTLILVSGTACLYCWLLNRRLRHLQDMKSGLGASIASLNKAVTRTASAAQEAKTSAAGSAAQLSQLLAEVEKCTPQIEDLIDRIDRSSRSAAGDVRRVQKELSFEVRRMNDDAKESAAQLLRVIELVHDHTHTLNQKYGNQSQGNPESGGDRLRLRANTTPGSSLDSEYEKAFNIQTSIDNVHRLSAKTN